MRTQKRFTPELLARYTKQGRGTGTYQHYAPWHRVSRGDPSSWGRSHLVMWRERQRELLSDGEWVGLLFSTMLSGLQDVREQHVLSLEHGPHEITSYDAGHIGRGYPGTLEIARQLGIKHPLVTGNGASTNWQMTTDQVLVLSQAASQIELLAVAYKPNEKDLTKRQRQLLLIEKTYWDVRGVRWLLITPHLFHESVGLKLRETAPWGLGAATSASQIKMASEVVKQTLGHSYTFTIHTLEHLLGDKDLAQRALWQGVWSAEIPLDLRSGWRPHLPLQLLSTEAFVDLNPIASRRSSWL